MAAAVLKKPKGSILKRRADGEIDNNPTKRKFIPSSRDKSRNCPYLDTINRHVLDFDFEKLCSVSLSRINVYACMVCGKYFQGRGPNTHCYMHSVQAGHHVFLNLTTLRFYCLPDNYEIIDSSLDDITYVLKPTFTPKEIAHLESNNKLSRAYDGTTYMPGIVGLNNIKANDYCNVILQSCGELFQDLSAFMKGQYDWQYKAEDQVWIKKKKLCTVWNEEIDCKHAWCDIALSHVPPLRNYFLREENYIKIPRPPGDIMVLLVQRFGELLRKLWNPRNFKAHVSPHEMLQAVVLCSKKKFQITEQGDPIAFLSWFLNSLHLALNGTKKDRSSIVYCAFRGSMRMYSRKVVPIDKSEEEKKQLLISDEYKEKMEKSNFLYLTVDLPPPPLYKDELKEKIIPQVPLFTILAKFNGTTEKEYKTYKDSTMKRFEIRKLPPYLILYIKRFTKNTFFVEKNPTIVNFPIKNVDMTELLHQSVRESHPKCVYDLIANIVHDGEPGAGKGTYRIHILHRGSGKWYEMQDLHVTEILPQMITLSEAYIQIWERKKVVPSVPASMEA